MIKIDQFEEYTSYVFSMIEKIYKVIYILLGNISNFKYVSIRIFLI